MTAAGARSRLAAAPSPGAAARPAECAELILVKGRKEGQLDPAADLGPEAVGLWHSFRRQWLMSGKSAVTLETYGAALAMLARHMGGDREVFDATRAQAEDFLLWVSAHQSTGSRRHHQASLSAVFGWAVKKELLAASPLAGVGRPAATAAPRRVLDDAELRALAATVARKCATPAAEFCRIRDAAMLSLWNEAGSPRLSEMAGITLDDLDLSRDRLLLHGKGGKDRYIVLSYSTAEAIARYLRARTRWAAGRRTRTEKLWLGERGLLGKSGAARMLADRAVQAGLGHVHPHILRHTAYSRFEERGGLPNDAMELFGWSSDTMTRLYGKSARARRAETRAREISLADL